MRIEAEFDADVVKIGMHKDDETCEITMTPTLAVIVDAGGAASLFGEELAALAFDGAAVRRFVKLKPSLLFEAHRVSFAGGEPRATIPVLDSVERINEARVRVCVKVPFVVEGKADLLAVVLAYDAGIRVRLMPPAQQELPLVAPELRSALRVLRDADAEVSA
jgi:hypothetical protein